MDREVREHLRTHPSRRCLTSSRSTATGAGLLRRSATAAATSTTTRGRSVVQSFENPDKARLYADVQDVTGGTLTSVVMPWTLTSVLTADRRGRPFLPFAARIPKGEPCDRFGKKAPPGEIRTRARLSSGRYRLSPVKFPLSARSISPRSITSRTTDSSWYWISQYSQGCFPARSARRSGPFRPRTAWRWWATGSTTAPIPPSEPP